jgi:hypothetical protein
MNWNGSLSLLKSLTNHTTKTAILLLFLTNLCIAQQDSLLIDTKTEKDTTIDTAFVMEKSPWGAVLRSAIVPGLGQIYNESYFKAAVIWGIEGALLAAWIFNNDRYKKNGDLYIQAQDLRLKPQYRDIRDFYRDQRDLVTIYMSLVYLLNLIDAYVDAHLFDFTVKEDFYTGIPMLGVKINF